MTCSLRFPNNLTWWTFTAWGNAERERREEEWIEIWTFSLNWEVLEYLQCVFTHIIQQYMAWLQLLLLSRVQLCDPIAGSPPGSRPWDSPGKNTGVGCHVLLQSMKVKSEVAQSLSRVQLCATPWTAAHQAPPSMGVSRKSTGVGCHCLLHDSS